MKIAVVKAKGVISPHVMDGFIEALKMLGHDIFEFDPRDGEHIQENIAELLLFSPHLALSYGGNAMIPCNDGSYFFRAHRITTVFLHYDAFYFSFSPEQMKEIKNNPTYYIHMIWDKYFFHFAHKEGFKNIFSIQLAVNPSLFYIDKQATEQKGVAFVGNISSDGANTQPTQIQQVEDFISHVINDKICNIGMPVTNIIDALVKYPQYAIFDDLRNEKSEEFWKLYFLIHHKGSLIVRDKYISAIENKPIDLYANSNPNRAGIVFKGPVNYRTELRKVYGCHAINLNISSLQLETSVNNRVFDCFASGGFLLSDYRYEIAGLFPDFWEEITFKNIKEMNLKVDYYLRNSSERKELTQKACEIITSDHTYIKRAAYVIDTAKSVIR